MSHRCPGGARTDGIALYQDRHDAPQQLLGETVNAGEYRTSGTHEGDFPGVVRP